jgi:methionyl-tRNA formyltransferase
MKVQILVDNPRSWMVPHAVELCEQVRDLGHEARLLQDPRAVESGDVLVLLSCERRFVDLAKNRHNVVVHESALPRGRGWSPLTWQILEGASEVPITLFEAVDAIDAGPIYLQDVMRFAGHELLPELRAEQARKTAELVLRFLESLPADGSRASGRPQEGEASHYPRRTPADSRLDLARSLAEQFDLLRVCDNERYPAWFERDGVKYVLRIEKAGA